MMKTLVQKRNSSLQKLNKKRKSDLCSLVITSGTKLLKQKASCRPKRKGESTGKRLFQKKESNKGELIGSSKKQKHEGFHGAQSLCSSSKNKEDIRALRNQKSNRQRRHKKKRTKSDLDEVSQLQRRARYLLIKLKLEQSFIDAYSGEGWKGQSREKIKPVKELLRAKKQILKCKLGLRDIFQQLDLLSSVGQIDNSLMGPDGSVHHEHIVCKKCQSQEVSEDNDIILCDGTCNCAFHQQCLDPPLATEDIPPEDEGWLCKYCDCKMEILEAINAHLGTMFSANSTWQDIFKEEALSSEVGSRDFNPEEEWPGDESDDNDYNPDADGSDCISRSSREYNDSNEESSSSSLCCSLESEAFSESEFSVERNRISCNLSLLYQNCAMEANEHEIINGPRQRAAVDYKKLYAEMFGKETTTGDICTEDEDWGPPRKRRREKESDAATTLMTLCDSEVKQSSSMKVDKNHLPSKARKQLSRIPSDVVEKLRQAFDENELPCRAIKKKISELVGLEYDKVNKWFKNARYMALKTRKAKGASHSLLSDKSDSKADKASELNVSNCSTSPTSTLKRNRLKRVTWNTNLTTLLSPLKRQRVKKTSFANDKDDMELSDDVSLKKHLLHLKKAKMRRKRQATPDNEHLQAQSAEKQLERLCRLETKLQKLKYILSTIQEHNTDESNERCSKEYVVYVPVAELKKKL